MFEYHIKLNLSLKLYPHKKWLVHNPFCINKIWKLANKQHLLISEKPFSYNPWFQEGELTFSGRFRSIRKNVPMFPVYMSVPSRYAHN